MKSKGGGDSRQNWRTRVREESLKQPHLGRRALSRRLATAGGPSEATIGKYLREEGLSQKGQRLAASPKSTTSTEPRLGAVLYVARLPCEAREPLSPTWLLGLDQASAYAFIACDADALSGSLEKLIGKSSNILGRWPDMVLLDRNGDRYFKIPKAAEDFAKGRGISLRLEGRWGKNLLSHRKRLEAIWYQTRLSEEVAEALEERIVDRYNYRESSLLPPCSGRTPFRTFMDLRGSRTSGSGDRP